MFAGETGVVMMTELRGVSNARAKRELGWTPAVRFAEGLGATVDWYRETRPPEHLPAVSAAVWEERQAAIHYASWRRTAKQVVHPLGLVLKAVERAPTAR